MRRKKIASNERKKETSCLKKHTADKGSADNNFWFPKSIYEQKLMRMMSQSQALYHGHLLQG